jgi:hypothetical protein
VQYLGQPQDQSETTVKLEEFLAEHHLWLGHSPTKGWVLLDRMRSDYTEWNRPFFILGNRTFEYLTPSEFALEPKGPWGLQFWKKIDQTTIKPVGTVFDLFPDLIRYVEDKTKQENLKPPKEPEPAPWFEFEPIAHDIDSVKKFIAQRRINLANEAQVSAESLRKLAVQICRGESGIEPAWSTGLKAVQHLKEHGITDLWHFTAIGNLQSIKHLGGLYSWAVLDTLDVSVEKLATSQSRNADLYFGRQYEVRLSFVQNSWFFHRAQRQKRNGIVWLRFALDALTVGEVRYSLGNAAKAKNLADDLTLAGIDLQLLKQFSPEKDRSSKRLNYPRLYPTEIDDANRFQQISDAWNSEILIKYFLPLEFCTGIFDGSTGDALNMDNTV